MRRSFLAAGIAIATLGWTQPGVAAPGDLLWSDRFDRARLDDRFHDVAIAGELACAVGTTGARPDTDGLVRCHDLGSGVLRWEDVFDLAGGDDGAVAVAADRRRVFVAGSGESASGDADFLVRAYDARSGLLLWQDAHDAAGGVDRARAVAVRNGTVFVAGPVSTPLLEKVAVRAYDAATGALRWQNLYDPPADFVLVDGIGVSGRWLGVVGAAETDVGEDDFLVHVIDSKTGVTAFDDLVDGAHRDNDRAWGVAMGDGRLFAVGSLDNVVSYDEGSVDLVVRAYDLRKQDLIWEDVFDGMQAPDAAAAAALSGGRLVVVGGAGEAKKGSQASDLLVRCYRARSGELLWEDRADFAGGFDEARAVAFGADAVLVSGRVTDALGVPQTVVRAYRPSTGALLFHDAFEAAEDAPASASAAGRRGVVAAAVADASQPDPGLVADAVIRAYRLR